MFRKFCDLYADFALGHTTLEDHIEIGTIWLNAQGTPKLCLQAEDLIKMYWWRGQPFWLKAMSIHIKNKNLKLRRALKFAS